MNAWRYGKPMKFRTITVFFCEEFYEEYSNESVQYGEKNGNEGFFIDNEFFSKKNFDFKAIA